MRLIDANAASDKIMNEIKIHADEMEIQSFLIMLHFSRILKNEKEFPTIEAEPVRHGHWITKDSSTAKCSCCGWWQHTTMYYLPDDISAFSRCYRFCTSCGTQMYEGNEK